MFLYDNNVVVIQCPGIERPSLSSEAPPTARFHPQSTLTALQNKKPRLRTWNPTNPHPGKCHFGRQHPGKLCLLRNPIQALLSAQVSAAANRSGGSHPPGFFSPSKSLVWCLLCGRMLCYSLAPDCQATFPFRADLTLTLSHVFDGGEFLILVIY